MKQRGTSLSEMMVVIAICALLVLIAVPAFKSLLASSRLHAAARQTVGDLREARALAIATGWESRLVGFGGSSTHPNRNQYRLMARRTSAVAWPSDTSPVLKNSTQRVEAWTDIPSNFPGVALDPGGTSTDDRFEIVFDSRGAAATSANDFNPFRLVGPGQPATITVSPPGGISIQ